MRHQVHGRILGRSSGQRNALRRTLMNQFIQHDIIDTTRAKALAIRGEVEKLVSLAKRGEFAAGEAQMVHARRVAASLPGQSGGGQAPVR